MKFKYIQQLDETDCGAAVLSMILKYYKSDVSISTIRNYAQTDQDGTSALGLVKAGEHLNLTTKAVQADLSLFDLNKDELSLPFIAHVDKENGFLHYIIVLKATKNYLLVADPDPAEKIHKISYSDFEKIWTGVTLFMAPNPDYQPVKEDKHGLWQTGKLLLKQKYIILTVVIATFLSTIITIAGAFFLQKIVDTYVPLGTENTLTIVSIGLLFAYLFHGIFGYVEGYLSTILGQRLSIDVLLSYLKHLFNLPMSFFSTRKTGELTSRFSDANNIITTLAQTAITTLLNIGTIVVIGGTLLFISPKLFLIALITIPVYGAIVMIFYKLFDKLNNQRMEQNATLSSEIIEDMHGIETIKSLGVENKSYAKVDRSFVKLLKTNYKYNINVILQGVFKDTAQLLITLCILYFGSIMAIHNQISVGELIAFNSLMGYFMNPIESIISLQNDLQTAKVANDRLNQIMLIEEEKDSQNMLSLSADNQDTTLLELENASFEFKYGQTVLNNLNTVIKEKESIAIVGVSGSGKSTLAKLLVNFYQPTTGKILFKQQDMKFISHHDIRNHINYLPQKPYIFSGSVLDNLLLGNKQNIDMNEVIKMAKLAGIHNDIEKLSDGYMTKLSEDSGLSGGQMQRIAIARSLLTQTEIMILDESTSSLDVITEKQVLNNLLSMSDKTLIFIAHRLEIAKKADRILVMDQGEIVESGNHQELMDKHGYYYKLWSE